VAVVPALPAHAATDVVAGPRAVDVLAAAGVDGLDRDRLEGRASRGTTRSRLAPRAAFAPSVVAPSVVGAPEVLVTERLPLAFPTVRRADASRYRGTEAVVQPGREGVLRRTYADLGPAGRRLLREEREREPVSRVVAVGTRARPTYGGLDWAALARCESGGDPRAVSGSGKFRGLYQFSMSTWRSVGGTGDPIDADRDAQTARAYALYQRDGRAPWPECGRNL
ncbi:MAG: Transglycosylase domain protein, partial [Frankiales bacterium]|nr:Transglycosylase domain protein [Frankiales bacterium]